TKLALQPDELGGVAGDAADLFAGLGRFGRRVDPDDPSLRATLVGELREAGDHPGLRAAGDRADDDGVEHHAQLALLLGDLMRPVGEAEPAERVVGSTRRDRIGLATGFLDLADGLLPAVFELDAELGLHQAHVGAGEPADEDVAHLVVDGVRPVDPAFLDQHAFHADASGDRRDLAGVVGLHTADGDERVAALRQCVGDQVLELAGLVPAEGDAGVAVLAFGPD